MGVTINTAVDKKCDHSDYITFYTLYSPTACMSEFSID